MGVRLRRGLWDGLRHGDRQPTLTRRWLLLAVLLGVVALTEPNKITFVQPRALVVLPGPRGVDVPIQTRIPLAADNRLWRLGWDGPGCAGGSSTRELHGEDDPVLMPAEKALEVRVFEGGCAFVAAVYGTGGKVLARGDVTIRTPDGGGADVK